MQVILGVEGVRLQSALARVTEQHAEKKAQVSTLAAQKLGFGNIEDAKAYAEKTLPNNYEDTLSKKERGLQFNKAVAGGVADEDFQRIELHDATDQLEEVLASTVAEVEQSAAEKVKARVKQLGHKGEEWLKDGTNFSDGEICPFCTQPLQDLDGIITAYRGYFSKAYETHVEKIVQCGRSVNEQLGPAAIEGIIRLLSSNSQKLKGLRAAGADISVSLDEIEIEALRADLSNIHSKLRSAAECKYRAPLEAQFLTEPQQQAQSLLRVYLTKLDSYNLAIGQLNDYLTGARQGSTAEARAVAEAELIQLKSLARKADKKFADECTFFLECHAEMQAFDVERKRLQDDLKKYGEAQSENFITGVNERLENLGADFKLRHKKPAFRAKEGTAEYSLEINEVEVPLGTANAGLEIPCFKTTLSTGDRRALALAFFLTELMQQDNMGDLIVVMDDPFSSFDANRRRLLIDLLVVIFPKVAQLIVLSHDMRFLKDVCQEIDKVTPKAARPLKSFLQIHKRSKSHSEIKCWDYEYDLAPQALKSCKTMCEHLDGTKPQEARFLVLECKIALEMFFKNAYPSWVKQDDNLQSIVKQIADDSHPLHSYHDIAKKINRLAPEYGHGGRDDRVEIETDEANVLVKEVLRAVNYKEFTLARENTASVRTLGEGSGDAGVDFTRRLER